MRILLVSFVLLGVGMAAETPAKSEDSLKAVSSGANTFSNHFLQAVSKTNIGNLIFSPLSVNFVLAMLSLGAGGKTLQQLRAGLHMPDDDSVTKAGYSALVGAFENVEGVELKLANKLFASESLPVKLGYLNSTRDVFKSEVQKLNFAKSADAAGAINDWCKANTNDRIKEIVKPDDLDDSTILVLANAIYFKGMWKIKFNPNSTTDRDFFLDKTTIKKVPTMYKKDQFNYGTVPNVPARFIELPYKNEEFSLVVILPNEVDGLESVKQNLEKVDISEMLKSGFKNEIELYLPKFKIESEIDLVPVLKEMGMDDMFGNTANFSAMSDTPAKVSKAIQKAFIEVNEEGSEAAAVTGMQAVLMSLPPIEWKFLIDRPFIAKIARISRKNEYEIDDVTTIFTGIIKKPEFDSE